MDEQNTKKHIITLGGLPGSGKSTIKRSIAEKLNFKTFSTGDFVRTLAADKGISLELLNEEIAKNKNLDEMIDAELIRIEKEDDNYIVDSHLAFHFVPSAFSVFLQISLDESAKRIFNDGDAEMRIKSGDTMKTLEEARERTEKRIQNHQERYMRHYGVDPYVPSLYDLVVDTENSLPEEITTTILEAYQAWIDS